MRHLPSELGKFVKQGASPSKGGGQEEVSLATPWPNVSTTNNHPRYDRPYTVIPLPSPAERTARKSREC